MKKLIFLVFLIGNLFADDSLSILTYEKPTGRLGDQLCCFVKAAWVSHYYDIPLYFPWFRYADQLALSKNYKIYEKQFEHLRKRRLRGSTQYIDELIYIDSNFSDKNTIYIIDQCFYHEKLKNSMDEIQKNVIHPYIIDYDDTFVEKGVNSPRPRNDEMIFSLKKDKIFLDQLKKIIHPISKLQKIEKPDNFISVAVHVRKGGGFDKPYKSTQEYTMNIETLRYSDFLINDSSVYYKTLSIIREDSCQKIPNTSATFKDSFVDTYQPLKHPPDQFYIDQIRGLLAMTGSVPLYIYIFTDDPDPSEIVKRYGKAINSRRATFMCRQKDNHYDSNVLHDLFAMCDFDCLIRPYSSLSQVAELIGSHKIVLSPRHGIWQNDKLIIDEVLITIYDKTFFTCTRN